MRSPIGLATILAGIAAALPAQRVEPGRWDQRSDIPDGWVVYNTRHYQVQSAVGRDKAKRLGQHMEAMWRVYVTTFRPDRNWDKRQPIKLFGSKKAYHAYGGPSGSAAYYHRIKREMVCYDTESWMDEEPELFDPNDEEAVSRLLKMDILGVAAHEGWHQYFHWYVTSMLSLPSWVNEGMGDYFYCARPVKVNGRTKTELGRLNRVRLPLIRRVVEAGRHVSFPAIVRYDQRDYYANPAICYAQGWSMCQFLLHHDNPRYRAIIPTFVKLMRDNSLVDANMDRALDGVDLAALEEEWKAWVLGTYLPEEIALREAGDGAAGGGAGGKFPVTPSGGKDDRRRRDGAEPRPAPDRGSGPAVASAGAAGGRGSGGRGPGHLARCRLRPTWTWTVR